MNKEKIKLYKDKGFKLVELWEYDIKKDALQALKDGITPFLVEMSNG